MKLDVSKVYFSPRLSAERKRIAELVREGERVLVLFAGVGPFALVIAKNKPRTKIVAVEINPDAVRYMRENMDLNKTKNIEAVEGDAKKLKLTDSAFDRVIMPLPKTAHEFLSAAFAAAKDGGIVHFYALADAKAPFDEAMERARDSAKQCGVSVEAESMRIVRPYSPLQVQVVLDLKVSKNSEGTPS
jgi:tRNA (guanine37-N1)-methyltransferase